MSRKASIGNSERKNKDEIKYKGVRRRRWGKWVSEIRVPGTSTRLWLGSYAAPEAAAVAHDTAVFFLRGPGPLPASSMNFPWRIGGAYMWAPLSPGSVQTVASDAGMTADAQLTEELWRLDKQELSERVFLEEERGRSESSDQGFGLHEEFNVDDMEIYM
ncbi:ethylene-responsive transcription factor ERF019-like protein [Carex littledalei]|uniref:Ethylene-responsive transcription factor ERF019-like protein n=1 Tax=Carex littledalei TaxID=544730 RepID=A0A833V959_9POAL|nr:ethylene-responsive transcription factor ERF019-like protein [Carex littledalei]